MANRTIYLYAKDKLGVVVQGVLFRILTTGGVFQTEGTTDGTGRAGPFVLADGTWHVAGSKQGTIWTLPYVVTVTKDESFDLACEVITLPVATDANRCRVYGVLRDGSGVPVGNAVLTFTPIDDALVVGGDPHMGPVQIKTGSNGVVDVELVRGIQYKVEVPHLAYAYSWAGSSDDVEPEGFTGSVRDVPDQASLALGAFLFPRPARIQFSAAALSVSIGATDSTKKVTVLLTNGVSASDAQTAALTYASSDTAIATMEVAENGTITVKGIAAGTATMTVVRKVYAPKTKPDTALVVDTFQVTVS